MTHTNCWSPRQSGALGCRRPRGTVALHYPPGATRSAASVYVAEHGRREQPCRFRRGLFSGWRGLRLAVYVEHLDPRQVFLGSVGPHLLELFDDASNAEGRFPNGLYFVEHFLLEGWVPGEFFRSEQNTRERVVDLVRDCRGEPADRGRASTGFRRRPFGSARAAMGDGRSPFQGFPSPARVRRELLGPVRIRPDRAAQRSRKSLRSRRPDPPCTYFSVPDPPTWPRWRESPRPVSPLP
jgi:hypothetical protein